MPDDVARAVGAGGRTVTIAGKDCTPRPLSVKELTEVERDCVERYKRAFVKTFSDNADLLPRKESQRIIQERMEEAGKWDVDDLPPKYAHDPAGVSLTKELKRWLVDAWDMNGEERDVQKLKNLCVAALDQKMLDGKQYSKMVGKLPVKRRVSYVNWWISGSYDGMITFVWVCFKHNGVTRDEVALEMGRNPRLLTELQREIETLSVPAAGNG